MKHVIMVNPVSGRKKGKKHALIVQKLLKKNNIDAKMVISSYAGQLKTLAYTISRNEEKTRFYVIGGDGTLNEVVSGIIGTDSEIVILPCGTGNDFASCVNEYKSLRKIILTSLKSKSEKVDLIKLNNNRYCINVLNAGLDAQIAYNMNKFRWVPFVSGSTKYNIAIAYTLFLAKNYRMRIRVNDTAIKDKFTLVAFANAKCYGGGIIPCKDSKLDDGVLNMCAAKQTNLLEKLVILPKYKKCKHEGHPKVIINNEVTKLSVVSNKKFPLSIDGEIIYTNRLKATIMPNMVNIVKIKKR